MRSRGCTAGGEIPVSAGKSRPVEETERPWKEAQSNLCAQCHSRYAESQRVSFLSDTDVTWRIGSDAEAFQLWRNGFESGLVEGATGQQLKDEEVADLAARISISRIVNQAQVKATIRRAIEGIDVMAAREATRRAAEIRTSRAGQS